MGFRYRKSINLGGGFRVNLSTKGIGYSWGVKGYRVTKTADGRTRQTVSIPGTGISYVEEHGKKRQQSAGSQTPVQPVDPYAGYSNVQQVTSADANTLRSGVYEELFRQIKWAKTIRIISVILTLLSSQVGMGFFYLCVAACVALFFLSRNYIEYEFDDVEQAKWEKLSAAWRAVASSQSLQEITVTAKAKNIRTNAGIENSVDTAKMTAGGKLPWYLRTNIKPVVFKLQNCQLAIMPDRLLIFSKKKLGAVDYTEAKIDITAEVGMGFFYLCVAACVALFFLSRNYIEYEFDDVEQAKWEKLSAAWRAVASSQSLQEITVTAKAKNIRTNAGIENSVDTAKMTAGGKLPWYLRTNIKPVVFKLQNCQLAIMPDRLLIFSKKKLGAVDYTEAKIDITAVGFLETGTIPTDSQMVKQVWAYANNDGSPDKRYANNRQYPVMQYGKVCISSPGGLNIQFMCSNEKASDTLYHIINP